MKRYDVYSESHYFEEYEKGDLIFYDDFVNFILARIEKLEQEINNEYSIYSEGSCRFRIDELKNLIK